MHNPAASLNLVQNASAHARFSLEKERLGNDHHPLPSLARGVNLADGEKSISRNGEVLYRILIRETNRHGVGDGLKAAHERGELAKGRLAGMLSAVPGLYRVLLVVA
jgi:hypothetical protein